MAELFGGSFIFFPRSRLLKYSNVYTGMWNHYRKGQRVLYLVFVPLCPRSTGPPPQLFSKQFESFFFIFLAISSPQSPTSWIRSAIWGEVSFEELINIPHPLSLLLVLCILAATSHPASVQVLRHETLTSPTVCLIYTQRTVFFVLSYTQIPSYIFSVEEANSVIFETH